MQQHIAVKVALLIDDSLCLNDQIEDDPKTSFVKIAACIAATIASLKCTMDRKEKYVWHY
jgi:hypothetical protein